MRRALTFGSVSKADLELRIADERFSEIVRLVDIKITDTNSIKSALDGYLSNINLLKDDLGYLKEGNVGLDKLMDKLVAAVINHGIAFGELSNLLSGRLDIQEKVNEIQRALVQILEGTIDNLQSLNEARFRIKNLVFGYQDPLKELRALEILAGVENLLKEDLLISLASNIQSGEVGFRSIENLPGGLLARLKIIDEARERVADVVLKSQIGFLRQQLLDKIAAANLLNGAVIADDINDAQKLLATIDAKKGGRFLEQVKYVLTEAQKALAAGDYNVALGQVSLANAILNNLSFELSLNIEGRVKEMALLKQDYDLLSGKSRNVFLEKQILELADLVKKEPFNERLLPGIREVKLILAHAR